MKKISKIAVFTLIVLLFSMIPVKAADSLTSYATLSKQQLIKGEEFTVTLSVKGMPKDAMKVLSAKVDFDNTILEYSKKTGKDVWQAVVSTDGTSITATAADPTEGEEVVTLTFKVKETIDITKITSAIITFRDIKVAIDEKEEKGDKIVSGCTAKITIGDKEQPVVEPTSEEPQEDPMPVEPEKKEETKTNDPTTSQAKSQPNTGLETTILPVIIAVFMIISIVSYTSYRKINKIV